MEGKQFDVQLAEWTGGVEWMPFLLGDSCLQEGDDGDADYSAGCRNIMKGVA